MADRDRDGSKKHEATCSGVKLHCELNSALVLDIRAHMHTGSDVTHGPHIRTLEVCATVHCINCIDGCGI
jgi:hypothetical protein